MNKIWKAYKLVWKRRRLRWRAFRSRRDLQVVVDRTTALRRDDIRAFLCVRNEALRLPHMLEHYRQLGVRHFLVVDNGSTDGSCDMLQGQSDVSLWQTDASYRGARFGLDWMNWLLAKYGHGAWCLLVDADELLVYPHHDTHDLTALTAWLDAHNRPAMGALMLDLYPRAALGETASGNPLDVVQWFDSGPYRSQRQEPLSNLWVQGGPRDRAFFADEGRRAPTLNKLPLVRWNRRYVFVNSTHSMLPRHLNYAYDGPGGDALSGVLLHTKFLPDIIARAEEDLERRQHFNDPDAFKRYYDALREGPSLWHDGSTKYSDWRQLQALNLMGQDGFPDR